LIRKETYFFRKEGRISRINIFGGLREERGIGKTRGLEVALLALSKGYNRRSQHRRIKHSKMKKTKNGTVSRKGGENSPKTKSGGSEGGMKGRQRRLFKENF